MQSRLPVTPNTSYKEICERLTQLNTPVVCDALSEVRLMDPMIAPVGENAKCVGRSYTVNSNQDSLSTMQALDDLLAFLVSLDPSMTDIAPIILTIASCGAPYALAGGMCANVAKIKGFGGVVIDGPCRDIDEIKASNLPFFAKGKCAKSGPKNRVGTRKEPIECGGINVNPGDIIFADQDGVVALNKEEAITVINKGEEIQVKEGIALDQIKAGKRFNEICNIDEHVKNLEAGIQSKLRLTV